MTVKGVDEAIKNLDILRDKFGDGVGDSLWAGGQVIRGNAVKSIQAVSSGRKTKRYTASNNAYAHIAAAAGSAPNTDTGFLVKSIAVEARPDGVYVGSSLKYAKWLEIGTSKMGARPWLLPAKLASEKKIVQLMKSGIKKVTK